MGGGGGFFSFLMPAVGAVVGNLLVPGSGIAIAAGAGIGSTAGGLMDNKDVGSSLLQGAVTGGTAYLGAKYLGTGGDYTKLAGADIGTKAATGALTAGAIGAGAGAAGGMVSGMVSDFLTPVPELQLPDFGPLKYGDGLDHLYEDAPEEPSTEDAVSAAQKRAAIEAEKAFGPVDTILTKTRDMEGSKPYLHTVALLGG